MNYEISEHNYLGFNLRGKSSGQIKTQCVFCQQDRTKNKNDKPVSIDIDKGVYNCHHCEKSGNIHKYKFEKEIKRDYVLPEWRNNTSISDSAVKYFKQRGIDQQTLIKMKITEGMEYMPQSEKEMNTIQFNYFRDGVLINTKFRTGDKKFKLVKDAELIFYNIDSVKDCAECIIVEGEIDALSYIQDDIENVISVPNGASKGNNNLQYLDNCMELLEHIETFYIATDNDEAGLNLRSELVRRLGVEKCKKVLFDDCNDPNEYFVKHNDLKRTIINAVDFPIDGIVRVQDFENEIDELYINGLKKGAITGLNDVDSLISYELGRMCIVTGIPGHGKSEFVDDVLERLNMRYGWKSALFSPENLPLQIHFSKIAEKIIGKSFSGDGRMSKNDLVDAKNYVNDNFFFIKPADESFGIDSILDKAKILIKSFGIKVLVIDPYNKLEHQIQHGVSETNYIGMLLDKVIMFSKRYNILVFLVAHPVKMKKTDNVFDIPTLYDVSGSANFYNKTDYGICVYRNWGEEIIDIHVQKVKFKHLGEPGLASIKYNVNNGRFTSIDKLTQTVEWDNANHLTYKKEDAPF